MAAIFFSSFFIALSGALMPGPLLSATISESTRRGAVTGPLLILGHGILEIALLVAILFGLAPFLERDIVFVVIDFFGGGFLIYMGVGMLRSVPHLSLSFDADSEGDGKPLVLHGALLSLANPYWIVWWATIGLGYVLISRQSGLPGIILFFSGHILADLLWYTGVSTVIAKGKRFIGDKIYRGLIIGCGVMIIGFAGYFVVSGIQRMV
jgi:threonine/homoserine/homoserine lactone efflux protein